MTWYNLFRPKQHPNWVADPSTQPPEPMWTEDADAFPVPTEAELNHQYRYKRIWEER